MARFTVVARAVQLYVTDIHAEDEAQAQQMANELEAQDFEYLDWGDWEILRVEKIHQKPKQASLF
ncbi:MAG: hypothetical protein WC443_08000 [Desulfobaccales bacterium]